MNLIYMPCMVRFWSGGMSLGKIKKSATFSKDTQRPATGHMTGQGSSIDFF